MRLFPIAIGVIGAWTVGSGSLEAKVRKGDKAPLFKTVDEKLGPVDMVDLIRDKPLVLVFGSAS